MKISTKLILVFLAIALSFGVIGFISLDASEKALKKTIGEYSVSLAVEALDKIDRSIYRRIEEIQVHSTHYSFIDTITESNQEFDRLDSIKEYIDGKNREWISAPKETVTPFMQELINNKLSSELRNSLEVYKERYGFDVFGGIFVTNKYGANVAQTGKTSDYYQADKEWWQKAKEEGLYVGDVEYDESTDINSISFGVGVYDFDGNFIGVIKAILNIQDVTDIIKDLELSGRDKEFKTRHFKLINKDGKLIYGPERFEFFETVSDDFLSHLQQHEEDQRRYFTGYETGEGEILFSHTHSKGYKDFEGLGWILIVEHKTEEIFAPINKLRNRLLTFIIIILTFAVMTGFVTSRNILKPITKLRDAADKISKGNLAEPVEVKSKDEIGELAESFDNMRYSLKMVIDEYEKMKAKEELSKQLEASRQQLEESETKYKTIFEGAMDGILAADAGTKKLLFANPRICKITGYSEEELLKLSVNDIHPKKDLPYVLDQFTKQLKKQITIAKDIPVLRKDKEIVYCDVNSTPMEIAGRKMLLGFFRDITEEKKRTEQLERFAKLSVGREEKMIELKNRIKELEKQVKKKNKK